MNPLIPKSKKKSNQYIAARRRKILMAACHTEKSLRIFAFPGPPLEPHAGIRYMPTPSIRDSCAGFPPKLISLEFRSEFCSKLISISTVKLEIPISNQNRIFFTYFGEKCVEISTFVLKFCTDIGIPMSESKIRNRNQNRNSDVEIETEIRISTSKLKSKFRKTKHRNFDEIRIKRDFVYT
jgi:hypothetical protein